MQLRTALVFLASCLGGAVLACTPDSSGNDDGPWQSCVNGMCPIGYECVANYCLPVDDSGETTQSMGDGDGDSGDGDGTPGDGDGMPGDGDGMPGDGDGMPGDGDGMPGDGDGDGDGDPGCPVGTEGCPCDGGVCAPGLVCDPGDVCVEPYCGDGQVGNGEDCDGNNLDGYNCLLLGYIGGGVLACDPVNCTFDTSGCNEDSCGNGIVDIGEQCDGGNLNGFDCQDLGYAGGVLACDPITCTYDASGCLGG